MRYAELSYAELRTATRQLLMDKNDNSYMKKK